VGVVDQPEHRFWPESGDEADDLGIGGEPSKGLLGEGDAVVDADLETPRRAAAVPPARPVASCRSGLPVCVMRQW